MARDRFQDDDADDRPRGYRRYDDDDDEPQIRDYERDSYGRSEGRRGSRPARDISSNLPLAIFSTVCCCLPLGIVAIIHAAKVDGLMLAGKYAQAQDAAEKAKMWAIISIILGAIGGVISAVIQVMLERAELNNNGF